MASPSRRRAGPDPQRRFAGELRQSQRRLEHAWTAFRGRDGGPGARQREQIVDDVLAELQVHAALEDSVLYPAARAAGADPAWLDVAEVDHEQMQALIGRLHGRRGEGNDAKYGARFKLLYEAALRHFVSERRELMPQLARAPVDWQALLHAWLQRREELTAVLEAGPAVSLGGASLGLRPAPDGEIPDNGVVSPGEGITSRKLAD